MYVCCHLLPLDAAQGVIGQVYNIGSSEEHTALDLARKVGRGWRSSAFSLVDDLVSKLEPCPACPTFATA
jgi:hypothetical protein